MLSQLLIAAVPFTMGALAEPLEGRANVAEAELYAYGPNGIGGFPIVNIGGMRPLYPFLTPRARIGAYFPRQRVY